MMALSGPVLIHHHWGRAFDMKSMQFTWKENDASRNKVEWFELKKSHWDRRTSNCHHSDMSYAVHNRHPYTTTHPIPTGITIAAANMYQPTKRLDLDQAGYTVAWNTLCLLKYKHIFFSVFPIPSLTAFTIIFFPTASLSLLAAKNKECWISRIISMMWLWNDTCFTSYDKRWFICYVFQDIC